MSSYVDIYKDFPTRCERVWELVRNAPSSGDADLSVTAMLMAAAAGFATPFENLKHLGAGSNQEWNSHPSFRGVKQKEYKQALKRFDGIFQVRISESPLFGIDAARAWRFARCLKLVEVRDVAERGTGETISDNEKVRFAVKLLRNALAHNNMFAFGSDASHISDLAFFSEERDGEGKPPVVTGWHVAVTSVAGFEAFLNQWFATIKGGPALRLVLSNALEKPGEVRAA